MSGDVDGVRASRYTGRVREVALNQEREDDRARLAELEDRLRRKPKPAAPAAKPKAAEKPGDGHLDITL
jgi:hypothetical protein